MLRYGLTQFQNERGFSLVESLLAMVILGTGLLAMSGMQAISLVRNVDANELTRVTTVASEMMERIYFNRRNAASYNGIDTQSATNCTTITQVQARGDCNLWDSLVDNTQLQNVKGTVLVSNVIDPKVLGQRTITVTITWIGSMKSGSTTKRPRSLTLNRVVAPE